MVIMPETDAAIAGVVAERIREYTENYAFHVSASETIAVTTSIGVASSLEGEAIAMETLKRADQALYQAKKNGRNRVVEAAS